MSAFIRRLSAQGVSLLELLLASGLIGVVVVFIALVLPNASKTVVSNQYRLGAKSVANGALQQLKEEPYPLVQPTAAANFDATNTLCDCSLDDFARIPKTTTLMNTVAYTVQACVNLVSRQSGAANWTATCPQGVSPTISNDTGLKNIHVRVSWNFGGAAQAINLESVVSRE